MTDIITMGRALKVPTDAVTQTVAFVGRKSSGKSYGAMKFCEGLHGVGAPFVAIDPVGNWYGLRLAADGKKPGLPIPVLGGEHGDLPLTPAAGAVVARFIIDSGTSAVIDVSRFRKADRKRFVADFAEELFHRAKSVRSPLMVVLEEAQKFAPQMYKGQERMLGAIEDIVRLGRNYGLGSTLITQRPQSVNKEVLNQVECLFIGQLNGAHERKAIKDWVVQNAADDGISDLVNDLPSLDVGEMMVWSPQWLKIFKKVRIGKKITFDASATPKLGDKRKERKLAPVDLGALETAMADTVEEAKRDDPKELRKQIRALERELAKKPNIEKHEIPIITDQQVDAVRKQIDELRNISGQLGSAHDTALEVVGAITKQMAAAGAAVDALSDALEKPKLQAELDQRVRDMRNNRTQQAKHAVVTTSKKGPQGYGGRTGDDPRAFQTDHPSESMAERSGATGSNGQLPKAERMLLKSLAQSARRLSIKQAAVLAEYSPKSSTVFNALGKLRSLGLIEGKNMSMAPTEEGDAVAVALFGDVKPPRGSALAQTWESRLPKAERSLLRVILDAYPGALTKAEAARRAYYSGASSTVYNALGKLRSLCLIEGTNSGGMTASELLID